jgi:hypothetical protein
MITLKEFSKEKEIGLTTLQRLVSQSDLKPLIKFSYGNVWGKVPSKWSKFELDNLYSNYIKEKGIIKQTLIENKTLIKIYRCRLINDDKWYVGQTRFSLNQKMKTLSKKETSPFFGWSKSDLYIELIELVEPELANEKERYYISIYGELNIQKGGRSGWIWKTDETIEEMKKSIEDGLTRKKFNIKFDLPVNSEYFDNVAKKFNLSKTFAIQTPYKEWKSVTSYLKHLVNIGLLPETNKTIKNNYSGYLYQLKRNDSSIIKYFDYNPLVA